MESIDFLFSDHKQAPTLYRPGEYLYRNNTPAEGVFFICSGKVKILSLADEGFLNQEIKSAGEFLALEEMDLEFFASDAIAIEETRAYFIDRLTLQGWLS